MDREIIVIAHNIRSSHNIGSLFRTCDGIGVEELYITGYSPYPLSKNDSRMPHIAKKINTQIEKTALGAERTVRWTNNEDIAKVLHALKKKGFKIVGLEQSAKSIILNEFSPPKKVALLLGNEVDGLEKYVMDQCDFLVEIPMAGIKESFNVVQAAAMALYSLRYIA